MRVQGCVARKVLFVNQRTARTIQHTYPISEELGRARMAVADYIEGRGAVTLDSVREHAPRAGAANDQPPGPRAEECPRNRAGAGWGPVSAHSLGPVRVPPLRGSDSSTGRLLRLPE